MLDSVTTLRAQIASRSLQASPKPGCYTWWFDEDGKNTILSPLNGLVDHSKIATRQINGRDFYALYFGSSKDLKARIKWHIGQKHAASTVGYGFLSTLRQTLSALLGLDMSKSEQAVNDFIDAHCWLEYDHCPSLAEAKQREKAQLCDGYYPLNIRGNKGVGKSVLAKLSEIRKQFKK